MMRLLSRECLTSQRKDVLRRRVGVEDDELARDREQRDQQHRLHLDDAFLLRDHAHDRMLEFERDQQRHHLAEDHLKDRVVQRVDPRSRRYELCAGSWAVPPTTLGGGGQRFFSFLAKRC
jgi:hypothetical protein